MTARDEAADRITRALLDGKGPYGILDALGSLIVYAADLRAERMRLSEEVIANHEPLVHSEQEIVNEWRASWWDEGSSPIPGTADS